MEQLGGFASANLVVLLIRGEAEAEPQPLQSKVERFRQPKGYCMKHDDGDRRAWISYV